MCRRTFALILVTLFIPLAVVSLGGASISTWVLDRNFYTGLLDNEALYDALLNSDIQAEIQRSLTQGRTGDYSAAAFTAGIGTILTPAYMREQVTQNVNAIFDLVEGKSKTLNLMIDLRPIKNNLSDNQQIAFATAYVGALSACTGSEPANPALPVCIPSDKSADQLISDIRESIPGFVRTIPDTIPLTQGLSEKDLAGLSVLSSGPFQTAISSILVACLLPMVILWLMIGFVGGTTFRGVLLWLGGSLLVPALFVLLIGTGVRGGVSQITGEAVEITLNSGGQSVELSPETRAALVQIGQSTGVKVADGLTNYGAIATGAAVVLLFMGVILRPRENQITELDMDGVPDKPKRM